MIINLGFLLGGFFLLITGVVLSDKFYSNWPGVIGLVLMCITFYGCLESPTATYERDHFQQMSDAREAECKTPSLVSEIDGVRLYSVKPGGCSSQIVYFSKSGTHTSHEECSGGKIHSCDTIIDETSNSHD